MNHIPQQRRNSLSETTSTALSEILFLLQNSTTKEGKEKANRQITVVMNLPSDSSPIMVMADMFQIFSDSASVQGNITEYLIINMQ